MRIRNRGFVALSLAAVFILIVSTAALGQEPVKEKTKETGAPEAKIATGRLYLAEFREPCGPPVMPSYLGEKVMAVLTGQGMQIAMGGLTPLVSREDLKYSLVATQGKTDLYTGRIYAEVGPGSELTLKNTEGKVVVLQVDVSQVCWDVDRSAALADAKAAKADYALIGRFRVEELTADVNVQGELSKQKSFRVNLDLVAVNPSDGAVVAIFSEERRQMDVSPEGAIAKAAKHLASKAADHLREVGAEKSLNWWAKP